MDCLFDPRWSPYAVGIGIGVLSWLSFLISRKPIACSTSFARTSGMIERLFRGKRVESKAYYREIGLSIDWQWMLVVGIIIGAGFSAAISGDFHLQWTPDLWAAAFGPDPLLRVAVALLGGIILGFGARWAGGCTSGHGISGTLQLALSSWIAALSFFAGGIVTAHLIFKVLA